jgi:hypothetical protein
MRRVIITICGGLSTLLISACSESNGVRVHQAPLPSAATAAATGDFTADAGSQGPATAAAVGHAVPATNPTEQP